MNAPAKSADQILREMRAFISGEPFSDPTAVNIMRDAAEWIENAVRQIAAAIRTPER